MTQAPNTDTKVAEEKIVHDDHVNTTSAATTLPLTIIGCGGAGIRIVAENARTTIKDYRMNYIALDTSTSNMEGVPADMKRVVLGDGHGSGGHRAENAPDITKHLPKVISEDMNLSDQIVILVCSSSGGSGSVLAPLLLKELIRKKIQTIVVTVTDINSLVYTKNSIRSLMTFENIASQMDYYLPMMIFSNSVASERIVTEDVIQHLRRMIMLFRLSYTGIDINDRRHWLNPKKTLGLASGIRMIDWVDHTDYKSRSSVIDTDDQTLFDSVMTIIPADSDPSEFDDLRFNALSAKIGYAPKNADKSFTFAARISNPGSNFQKHISMMSDRQKDLESFANRTAVRNIDTEDMKPDDNGLFL